MDDDRGGKTSKKGELEDEFSIEKAKRSVTITNIPKGTTEDKLYIHFQKKCNGGGDIDDLVMLGNGKAILTYDKAKVAERVLTKEQNFGGVVLQLKSYANTEQPGLEVDVFSLVSARINPTMFNMSPEEMKDLLSKISEETHIQSIELSDGFYVSGTYQQIRATCAKLSLSATPKEAHDDQVSSNVNVLEVQPKLMYILRDSIKDIEKKYKLKIEHKENADKATLVSLDEGRTMFETGKDEFINLYQKTFQQMDEETFELTNTANFEELSQKVMEDLDVIVERKDKMICVYGKEDHVKQAKMRLQGKPKRSARKACNPTSAPNSEVLPKPDILKQLPQTLAHQLENGVTVSVYQGDITNQRVDVIVNAANERLEHGGGVAGAIVRKGGYEIQQESRQLVQKYGSVPVGRVLFTNPGRLPCNKIIHAVGPQWDVHGPEGSRHLIFNACMNSFNVASNNGARSIVLPAISSGIFGVPKEVCAEVLFYAAETFSLNATPQNHLIDIRFVNIDSPTNDAFRREFIKRYLKKPDDKEIDTSQQSGSNPKQVDDNSKDKVQAVSTNKDVTPSNFTSSKDVSNKHEERSLSDAGAAAVERYESNKTNHDVPTSNNPPLRVDPATFQAGFERRQTKTQRETNTEDTVGHQAKKGNKTAHREAETKKGHGEDYTPDVSETVRSERRTEIKKSETESTGNRELQPKDEGTRTTIPPEAEQSHSNQTKSTLGHKDVIVNGRQSKKSELKNLGRGRGALNLAAFFPHSPGVAHRETSPASGKPDATDDDNRQTEDLPPPEAQGDTNHLHVTEASLSDDKKLSQENDASSSTISEQKQESLSSQPPQQNADLPATSEVASSPPGLAVSEEGLNLASTCRLQDSSSPSDRSIKRKVDEASTEISAKMRKKDEELDRRDGGQQSALKPMNREEKIDKVIDEEDLGSDNVDNQNNSELEPNESAHNKEQSDSDERSPTRSNEGQDGGDTPHDADHSNVLVHETPIPKEHMKSSDAVTSLQNPGNIDNVKDQADEGTRTAKPQLESNGNGNTEKEVQQEGTEESHSKDKDLTVTSEDTLQGSSKDAGEGANSGKGSTKIDVQQDDTEESHSKDKDLTVTNEDTSQGSNKVAPGGTNSGKDSTKNDVHQDNNEKSHRKGKDFKVANEDTTQSIRNDAAEGTNNGKGNTKIDVQQENTGESPSKDEDFTVTNEDTSQDTSKDAAEGTNSGEDSVEKSSSDANMRNDDQDAKESSENGEEKSSHKDTNKSETVETIKLNNTEIMKKATVAVGLNDLGRSNEQETDANDLSMKSFVVLNIEDKNQFDGQTTSDGRRESEESGSSESIVIVNSPDEDETKCESEPNNKKNINAKALDEADVFRQEHKRDSNLHTKATNDECNEEKITENANKSQTELEGPKPTGSECSCGKDGKSEQENEHGDKHEGVDDPVEGLLQAFGGLHLSTPVGKTGKKEDSGKKKDSIPGNDQTECGLCNSALTKDKPSMILCGCGHLICKGCEIKYQNSKYNVCPICEKKVRWNVLQPPNGQMKNGILETSLAGFDDNKTIYIDFYIPNGIQGSRHPNPGHPYESLERRTFLPNTPEGREILHLLQKAFEAGLLFTVGQARSVSNGPMKDNQVIFSDVVDHKINLKGKPDGYPDPEYIGRAKKKLLRALQKNSPSLST